MDAPCQIQARIPSPQPDRGYPIAVMSAAVYHHRYLYSPPDPDLTSPRWCWRLGLLLVWLTLGPVLALLRPALLCDQEQLRYLGLYGVQLAIFNSLWTLSVALNGAAVATVLVYSSAAFTALLGRWLLKEPLNWAKLAAVALSLAGCVLVSEAYDPGTWGGNPIGIVTGVLSGLGYAVYTLMGRSASQRGLNPWTTLVYSFGFASAVVLVANLLPGEVMPGAAVRAADMFWLGRGMDRVGHRVVLAAGPTVMGFGLYMVSLTYLPSSIVNLIVSLKPPFTAAIAYVLLGERA
jgi:drug/metabolite transporter (DMT)-like permease